MGYFAALYRQVTVEVRAAIHSGLFDDGTRMDRFDTLFGNEGCRQFPRHCDRVAAPGRRYRVRQGGQ